MYIFLDMFLYWIYFANNCGVLFSWGVSVCPSGTGLGHVQQKGPHNCLFWWPEKCLDDDYWTTKLHFLVTGQVPGGQVPGYMPGQTSARQTSARPDNCQGGQVPGHGTCPTGTCQGVTCLLTWKPHKPLCRWGTSFWRGICQVLIPSCTITSQ